MNNQHRTFVKTKALFQSGVIYFQKLFLWVLCEADIIEKIDIGGISLIRAGAKNFKDVVIVPSKAEYGMLQEILNKQGAATTLEQRREFATKAFGVSSHYDTAIHSWFVK